MLLDAKAGFPENLERLLRTVEDDALVALLRDHTSTVMALNEESSRQRREPLVRAIRDLIELRATATKEEVDGSGGGTDEG